MAISDKTRKILWARSGNRCAICKRELVIDATSLDEESIVGEECHIISGKVNGPRYDPSFPSDKLDSYENLILLCRTHHKMVDDQYEIYTADILRQKKTNHEKWVSEKLEEDNRVGRLRLRRVKNSTPEYLVRLTSGKEILWIVEGAYAYSFSHDELKDESEVELVGGFLQEIQDWMDLSPMEPYERVNAEFALTNSLKILEDVGFFVFGGREIQVLEGGVDGPSDWPVAIIRVLRKTNKSIIRVPTNSDFSDSSLSLNDLDDESSQGG